MTVGLVATIVVRDEIDIIAANLDHLLFQGVGHVLVTDNGSRDGTREVLAWYENTRPVTVFDEPVGPFWQGRWVTRMARLAARDLGADWLIHVDADEFPVHPTMRLRDVVESIDQEADVLRIPRRQYVAVDGVCGEVAPLVNVVHIAESWNLHGQPVLGKVAHRADPEVVVADGNHAVEGASLTRSMSLPGLIVHHYPARSLAQASRKVTNLAEGRIMAGLTSTGVGTRAVARRRMIDEGVFEAEYYSAYGRSPKGIEDGLSDGSLVTDSAVSSIVRAARSGPSSTTRSKVGFGVDRWIRSAPPDGASSHKIDGLLSNGRERCRAMTIYQMQARQTIRDARALIDGPLVLMKGIEIAQLYPDPWRRDFVDVDLLVNDADRADQVLRRNGFVPFDALRTLPGYHQTAPLVRPGSPITLELHRRPSSPRWAHFPTSEIIAHGRPSRTGVDGVIRPRDDHHFVIIAWHYWRDGAHRARDLIDLHLLRQQAGDEHIEATARAWGVGRVWASTRTVLDALDEYRVETPRRIRWLLDLQPVSHRSRRLRQWWGISMGGRGGLAELWERDVRRRQRRR